MTVILATTISQERHHHRYQHGKLIKVIQTNTNGRRNNSNETYSEKEVVNNNFSV